MLNTIKVALIGAIVALNGCASPEEKAKSADDAQREAEEKAAQAGENAAERGEDAQRRADEEKARIAREEAGKVEAAQADAARKSADAAETLVKARADARQSSETRLTGLEGQFAELKPKLVKKLSKKEADVLLKDLTDKAEAARKSIGDLDSSTADSLEPVKATIKQRLDDYEQALNEAKKRT